MKWDSVFTAIKSISTADAKSYIESTATGSYQLIDVRQPEEFMKQHLPGALLIPLNDLIAEKAVLEKEKPTLVYCKNGDRSMAASQWLINQGYKDIRHVEGGIDAWLGKKAFGHYGLNLNLLKQETEFPDAISMAFAMEEGLRLFYMELARETSDETFQKLYRKLASFEVEHKADLSRKYLSVEGKELIQKEVDERHGQIMEGGGFADITLIKALGKTEEMSDVFGLALAFEIQAFDFYVRLSQHAVRPTVKDFFLEMADAEKKHLAFIAKEMDKYLNP
ncbi:MAG: rhodanese-like domain-containing protein [bacterium]